MGSGINEKLRLEIERLNDVVYKLNCRVTDLKGMKNACSEAYQRGSAENSALKHNIDYYKKQLDDIHKVLGWKRAKDFVSEGPAPLHDAEDPTNMDMLFKAAKDVRD